MVFLWFSCGLDFPSEKKSFQGTILGNPIFKPEPRRKTHERASSTACWRRGPHTPLGKSPLRRLRSVTRGALQTRTS